MILALIIKLLKPLLGYGAVFLMGVVLTLFWSFEHSKIQTEKKTVEAFQGQIQAVKQAEKIQTITETKLIYVHDKTQQAAQEAHNDINAIPLADPATCDYSHVIDVWRSGLERLSDSGSAASVDDTSDGAPKLRGSVP